MLTDMLMMKCIETLTLNCREIYDDVDSGVGDKIGSGSDEEV